MGGDADVARVAALIADRARSRILLALMGGRQLAAGTLADEAGVSRSTASSHLRKLTEAGLVAVRADGRRRHYRLADPAVAELLERLVALAPREPVTSLRDSTRAERLRRARSCYDHLAGRLGVGIMSGMLERGFLLGGDGLYDDARDGRDSPAAAGRDHRYELTTEGRDFLDRLGVRLAGGRRPVVRYCVDWTETRHHLAGQVGRGLRDRFLDAGWVEPDGPRRALRVTAPGADVLRREFGLSDQGWS